MKLHVGTARGLDFVNQAGNGRRQTSSRMLDRLKAQGLTSEIIAWKLRLFVPLGDDAAKIVEKLLALYPLLRVAPATRANS